MYPTPAPRIKRSTSTEFTKNLFGSRRRSRWHSLSNRWHSRRATLGVSNQNVQSAPPTPSYSRRPSASQSLASSLNPRQTAIFSEPQSVVYADSTFGAATAPEDIPASSPVEEPVDRSMSITPLLPPMLTNLDASQEAFQSPLQSPTVASYSETASLRSPLPSGIMTPPLSSKPSVTSIGMRPHQFQPDEEPDYWSRMLGHANFDIEPQPYYPTQCTYETCRQLLRDWEAARVEYMRVAARVNEHYGPSSPTYRLTEEKWAEIDREWHTNLDRANAEAEANGETPVSQCLAETQPLSKMPSLVDPNQPAKFLNIAEADIVGPMVQYVKIQQPPSPKRAGIFNILKNHSSFMANSVFGMKR
jgi:hypothetical protein